MRIIHTKHRYRYMVGLYRIHCNKRNCQITHSPAGTHVPVSYHNNNTFLIGKKIQFRWPQTACLLIHVI